ncbi:MAG: hypothetical protein K2I82_03740 [Ruminococcus sp.]|nr:hypothetical protein [Ruminococcus sp.]
MKEEQDFQEVKLPDNKSKRTLIGISAGIAIIVAVVIFTAVFVGLNAYRRPIKDVTKGVNKADTLLLMESIYPEDIITVKRINKKDSGTSWKDYLRQNDDYIESQMDKMGLKKAKCDIVAKEKISGSNLTNIKNFYQEAYEADVKKAYRVEVNMTFKTNGGNETPSGWLCVVKLKDEGWKFCPEYSEDHFDFIDKAVNFQ